MLNIIHHQGKFDEKLSLAIHTKSGNNGILTQNYTAVSHTAKTGFFIAQNTGQACHYTAQVVRTLMVWLIPQNKPFGEYGERLLYRPRVRPYHPIFRVLTQNNTGAFPC